MRDPTCSGGGGVFGGGAASRFDCDEKRLTSSFTIHVSRKEALRIMGPDAARSVPSAVYFEIPVGGNGRSASEWAAAFRTVIDSVSRAAELKLPFGGSILNPVYHSALEAVGKFAAKAAKAAEQQYNRARRPSPEEVAGRLSEGSLQQEPRAAAVARWLQSRTDGAELTDAEQRQVLALSSSVAGAGAGGQQGGDAAPLSPAEDAAGKGREPSPGQHVGWAAEGGGASPAPTGGSGGGGGPTPPRQVRSGGPSEFTAGAAAASAAATTAAATTSAAQGTPGVAAPSSLSLAAARAAAVDGDGRPTRLFGCALRLAPAVQTPRLPPFLLSLSHSARARALGSRRESSGALVRALTRPSGPPPPPSSPPGLAPRACLGSATGPASRRRGPPATPPESGTRG